MTCRARGDSRIGLSFVIESSASRFHDLSHHLFARDSHVWPPFPRNILQYLRDIEQLGHRRYLTYPTNTEAPKSPSFPTAFPPVKSSPMRPPAAFLLLAACAVPIRSAHSDDVVELAAKIDHHIDAQLAAEGVDSLPPVDAGSFLRRVTLDLAGRIPTVAELDAYSAADDNDAKLHVVQRLIDSPDFPYHTRNQLDIMLLLRDEHNNEWREYLLEATRENRPWDQLFREIFLPEDTLSTDVRPVSYLKRRVRDVDAMTNDSSVTWLGVNIACAKCHDHPLVEDWTQAHYYGMASFFKRTFLTKKGFLSERFEGALKYTNVSGEEHTADLMFLTGAKVEAPAVTFEGDALKELQEKIKKSEKDEKAEAPPRPDFRPRSKFVELTLTDTQHRFFAKNIVNRTWARFFGRGLVHPLDQMHSQNPASHPELLDTLAEDVHAAGYDIRRLIHAIVLSETYARGGRTEAAGEAPAPELFAVSRPRPLSPRQLSLSLRIASQNPEKLLGLEGEEDWEKRREQLENRADGQARQLAIPGDDFQVSVSEALWFSNNGSVSGDFLNGGGDRLVGYLKKVESDNEAAMAAFRSVLSRQPDEEEKEAVVSYLATRTDRREEAIKQIVWGHDEFTRVSI